MEENTSRAVPVSRIAQILEFCEVEIVGYKNDVWTIRKNDNDGFTIFLANPETELQAMEAIKTALDDIFIDEQSRSYEIITRLIELTKKREAC